MKKSNRILSIALLVIIVALSSCSKDEESMSNTQIITSKTWVQSKVEMSYAGKSYDISSQWIEDCYKDNSIKFLADGKYEEDAGTDNCDGDDTNASGTWSWKNNETVISVLIDGDTVEFKVVSMSSGSMKFNSGSMEYDTDGDGVEDQTVDLIITLSPR